MDFTSLKQILVGAGIAIMTTIGVKMSDVKLISYRVEQVEKKVDKIIEHLGVQ